MRSRSRAARSFAAIVVRRLVKAAGLEGDFAGHSLRSGFATAAVRAGEADNAPRRPFCEFDSVAVQAAGPLGTATARDEARHRHRAPDRRASCVDGAERLRCIPRSVGHESEEVPLAASIGDVGRSDVLQVPLDGTPLKCGIMLEKRIFFR